MGTLSLSAAGDAVAYHSPTSLEEGRAPKSEEDGGVAQEHSGSSLSREDSLGSVTDDWVNLSSSSHPLVTSND